MAADGTVGFGAYPIAAYRPDTSYGMWYVIRFVDGCGKYTSYVSSIRSA